MQFSNRAAAALGALALLGFGGTHAQAQSFTTPGQYIQDNWYVDDHTPGTSQINLVPTPSNDGDGSLQLAVTGGGKASVYHPSNVSLSTLNATNELTFDNYAASGASNEAPAYRLYLGNGSSLVWEVSNTGNGTPTQGQWQSFDVSTGTFWLHANGTNYNAAGQYYTLTDWLNGNTGGLGNESGQNVTGYELSLGSGVPDYTGNIDHVGFNGHVTDFQTDSTPAPEPSSVAAFAFTGLGAAGLILKARKRKIVA